jgi:hypothetical protein
MFRASITPRMPVHPGSWPRLRTAPGRVVVTSGQTTTYPHQIPVAGSTGNVNLTCRGAPQSSTRSVNPATIALSGTATAPATMSVTTGQSGSAPANSCTRGSFLGKFRLLALLVPCGEFRGKLRERGGESFVRATGKCYPNRHPYDHGNRDCAGIGQSVPLTLNVE